MAEIKGTRTEQNLLKAFAGESQARMRYTYYAEQALGENYPQIAVISQVPPIRNSSTRASSSSS